MSSKSLIRASGLRPGDEIVGYRFTGEADPIRIETTRIVKSVTRYVMVCIETSEGDTFEYPCKHLVPAIRTPAAGSSQEMRT